MAVGEMANILLVDDTPARLLTYEAILGSLGHRLIRAQSGDEALARLLETEVATILLDVSMPGLDGFETAALIRGHPRSAQTPIIFVTGVHLTDIDRLRGYETMGETRQDGKNRRLPIIALTAKAMMGDRDKSLQAGASDYLAKPVNTEQLISAWRMWLHR